MDLISNIIKKRNNIFVRESKPAVGDGYYSEVQERLAETYLSSSLNRPKERKKWPPATQEKATKKYRLPAAILLVSILILAAIFFMLANSNLKIDIDVVRETPPPFENLLISEDVSFSEGAALKRGYVYLPSPEGDRPSAVSIDLDERIDLVNNSLLVGVTLKRGRGDLKVVLRDANHRSYIADILKMRMADRDRLNFIVSTDGAKNSIDIRKIQHVRFELEPAKSARAKKALMHLDKVLLIDNNKVN